MISLRKHIDNFRTGTRHPGLDAFRSSLLAMAECGQRAVPALGPDLNLKLTKIADSVGPDALPQATEEARAELSAWADRAFEHHSDNEREIREIVGVVAKAAETISEKSHKYTREIGDVNTRLRAIADLNDLGVIRRSILESTHALKTCMEQMADDNKTAVAHLAAEITDYRSRLEESERVSSTDPLTGLANRRAFERKLQARIDTHQPSCLIMLDMNDFKRVNDSYGHLAGDDLLRQFADELKSQFSATDLVARWGGDEFAIIVACSLAEAEERVQRIRRWVFGEYKLSTLTPPAKVETSASIGLVQWNGKDDVASLLARADREVYRAKTTSCRVSKAPA